MRFLQLDLRAYGPFRGGPPIELDGGARGLHLIQGANEAGKSTALRAIRALLFGFPKSTGDAHGRDYDALRLAAVIRDESGSELAFLRRKRDVKPLWTFDDAEELSRDALLPFLGDLDESRFNDLFSIDHAELVRGGALIVSGKGRLGEMLFAAGSGLARVEDVRKRLEAEMNALYLKQGSKPAINAALLELTAASREAEESMLATQSWVELDREIAAKQARSGSVVAEVRRVEAEKRRLERLGAALPVLRRQAETAAALAERTGVPVLSEGFADRRFRALADRDTATRADRDAARNLEEVGAELDRLGERDPVLDEAGAIRLVREELGAYRNAVADRPGAVERLARLEADARARLADLRPGSDLDDLGAFRAPPALRERVQALILESGRREAQVDSAEGEVARLAGSAPPPAGTADLGEAEAAARAEALGRAIDRAIDRGDLEARLAEGRKALDSAGREAAVALRALALWSGSLDDLVALATPSAATINRFDAEHRGDDDAVARAEDALREAEGELIKLDGEIERAGLGDAPPTEADLGRRRDAREETWRKVRRAWVDGEGPSGGPGALADAFEADVRLADDAADRLRREAGRIAERDRRMLGRREAAARLARLAGAAELARLARLTGRLAWIDLWRGLGIEPLPPREMNDWLLTGRAALVRQAGQLREGRADLAAQAGQIDSIRAELGRHLGGLGEPPAEPPEALAALLARGRAAVDRVRDGSRLAAARLALEKAEAALGAWRGRWAEAVGPLGLVADASPAEANAALRRIDALADADRLAREARGAIAAQARVEDRFEALVVALAGRLGLGAVEGPIEAVASDLAGRLGRAEIDDGLRKAALRRQADEKARRAEARAAAARAEGAVAALVLEAKGASAADLADAERASDEVKRLRDRLLELDDQLALLAGLIPPGKLREEAGGCDPEGLEARIADLADALAPLEAERDELTEEVGRCRQRLDAMDGGPGAADATQGVAERLARLAGDVEHYTRLKLASAVLARAIERHREKNQGSVLGRAGDLFAALTAGSFAGLRADVDEKGQPILRGLRADGATPLDVDAMSEGTADQLYLALRLASLEVHLDDPKNQPMPLVVDDILVNFDDARALAALRALAQLSKRTQVLFFTHHDHLIELARPAIDPALLFIHRLDPDAQIQPQAEPIKPKRRKKAGALSDDT